MSIPEFRKAMPEDWPGIWRIFQAVVAAGETYMFSPTIGQKEARAAWLFDGLHRHATYVAMLDGQIVGSAILKPNQPGLGDHVANAAWMIDSEFAGRGVGRRFALYVIQEACRLGFQSMQFNAVVATNLRAIHLWKSLGFQILGTVPGAFRHASLGLQPVHIMHRRLEEFSSIQ